MQFSILLFSFSLSATHLPFSFCLILLKWFVSLFRSVMMAQCTCAFVKGKDYGFNQVGKGYQAAFA